MMMVISIDPGANGGIACRDNDGRIWADPMPDGMTDIFSYLDILVFPYGPSNIRCVMEKTGGYMPGNSGPAAATFARHCGHLEMALFALKIPCEQIAPQVWMKGLGTWPKDKKERKAAIKESVQRKFPHLRVTLRTSDALGLLAYWMNKNL